MIRNRVFLKAIAVFLIVETLVSTVAPTISWALTAGPTAPEATSFEPVDTTDMVNLATGDLAYNIPLLEVPGPSGGYPLSLSYHAGIQPNEDASWTGLGWTLNPGAIVRNVNGFADDQAKVANSSRFFWEGGETTTYSIGISVGALGTAGSVSAGLSFSQDTYQGSGIGFNVGVGNNLVKGSPLRFGVSVGISPYGDPYASTGLNVSVGLSEKSAGKLSAGIGISTNFKSVSGYSSAGLNVGSFSAVDATISTGSGGSVGVSIAGASYASNSRTGKLSVSSEGFELPIPISPLTWLSLGYSHQRYWIDQIDRIQVNGALNYPVALNPTDVFSTHYFDQKAFDTYSLYDPNLDGGIVYNPDPDKVLGGSFPNYDNYQVHAQGIFGSMRPYYFQKHLYKRNNFSVDDDDDKHYQTIQYDLAINQDKESKRAEFRFINDYSNRFEYTPSTIDATANATMQYNFASGTDLRVGENASSSYTTNQVQGSRNILWFTNEDIVGNRENVTDAGFIDTKSTGFDRRSPENVQRRDQIGGYTITNESGVKYHFALPAYSYDEYAYSEKKDGVETFNEFYKRQGYAYTWYLTAITGPDYADRGPDGPADGVLNKYDWGYWVEFEYGRWTDKYTWRNPSENMDPDIDNNFQNFSEGRKELYYLDAIRTKTHTALFVKDIRPDAKSSLYFFRDKASNDLAGPLDTKETIVDATKTGGFIPKTASCTCKRSTGDFFNKDEGTLEYVSLPTSTLKLTSVILIDNKTLESQNVTKDFGQEYSQSMSFDWEVESDDYPGLLQCIFSTVTLNHHFYENVFDVHDLEQSPGIRQNALRVIELDTDNSLCPETSNSFDLTPFTGPPSENDASYPKQGKLTLNGLRFLGKGGACLLPAMRFEYDLEEPVTGESDLIVNAGTYKFFRSNSGLVEGDLIEFVREGMQCYALVKSINGLEHLLKILGRNIPSSGPITFKTTKNPPYNEDHVDIWGLYKSDFDPNSTVTNENLTRLVSSLSERSLDVWSLRSVKTATGSTIAINYEPDTYKKPILFSGQNLRVEAIQQESNSTNYLITVLDEIPDLDRILHVDDQINFLFLFDHLVDDPLIPGAPYLIPVVYEGSLPIYSIDKSENGKWVIETRDLSIDLGPTNLFTRYWIAGNLSHNNSFSNPGGGLRVSSIETSSLNMSHKTHYKYNDIDGLFTSGATSYEPSGLDQAYLQFPEILENHSQFENWKKYSEDAYNGQLYRFFSNLLANAREAPAPGVLYEYVTVEESVAQNGVEEDLPNHTTYQFEVFKDGMVDIGYDPIASSTFSQKTHEGYIKYSKKETRNVSIKDYSSRVGSLKKITLYNRDGEKISETTNQYLHDGIQEALAATGYSEEEEDFEFKANRTIYEAWLADQYNNQGVIEETFTDARFANTPEGPSDFTLQGIVSKREQFPVIQTGQKTINYKTGITTETSTLAFDYYSGQPTKTLSSDEYGNTYLSEITPAYRQYSAMGQTANGGKNMLTQQAATYAYKVDPTQNNAKIGVVSGSIQTWSDEIPILHDSQYFAGEAEEQPGIWRKASSYSFVGEDNVTLQQDGLYRISNFTPFNAWTEGTATPSGWQRNETIKLYDIQSHPLEVVDLNGNYAATKVTSNKERVLATIANARYDEFGQSGAEDIDGNNYSGGAISLGSAVTDQSYTHTGANSFKLTSNTSGVNGSVLTRKKNYERKMHVSFWLHQSSTQEISLGYKFVAGLSTPGEYTEIPVTVSASKKAGEWYLFEADVSIPQSTSTPEPVVYFQTTISNGGGTPVYVDDIRIHPVDAAMSSYVYNQWGELSHILDNNNLYTEFRYDDMGRLTETFVETFNHGSVRTTEVKYHYAKQSECSEP